MERSAVAGRLAAIESEISSVTAARARIALSTMFAWAIGEGIADNNPVIGTNKPAEPAARDRVLTDAEIADIWRGCRDDDFGRIVRLLLLTGARRDEIGDLAWNEIDFDRAAINLPPERTKNNRPNVVPLAPAAVAILKGAPRRARPDATIDHVFGEGEGGYSGWSKGKIALDQRINAARAEAAGAPGKPQPIADWRLHDLRRTAATVMADRLAVLPHVIEAVLNHVSGHKAGVAGVYNRALYAAEKAAALTRWADHVRSVVEGVEQRIVPLSRRA